MRYITDIFCGSIMHVLSYIIEMLLLLEYTNNLENEAYTPAYRQNVYTLHRFCAIYSLLQFTSTVSDPFLHSAVRDVTSCELNLPPMSSFTTGRFTELLKPDLESPERWITRLWHGCHRVPTAGTKASMSWGLSVCRRLDNVVIFAARLSKSSWTSGKKSGD